MPAVMKKRKSKVANITPPSPKAKKTLKKRIPKSKLISSQLGVTTVKKPRSTRPYDPARANRGVVFIKHIPHGFYEDQLKSYFEQFGQVTRTRVARSEKSGRSRGYAFVEFRLPEVAQIAADTMNNYLMFKHVLKTAYIPPEEQKFNYFNSTVRTVTDDNGVRHLVTPKTERVEKALSQINRVPTQKEHTNRVQRAMYKLKKTQEKYAAKNIDLDLKFVPQNAMNTAGPSKLKKSKIAAKSSKKNANKKNDTLTKLVNDTIKDDENTSDDEDYIPDLIRNVKSGSSDTKESFSAEDLTSALKKANKRKVKIIEYSANKKKKASISNDDTLERLLNNTIDESDTDDEEFVPVQIVAKQDKKNKKSLSVQPIDTHNLMKLTPAAAKVPLRDNKNNSKKTPMTLEKLMNETINSDADSSDEEFQLSADKSSLDLSTLSSAPSTPSPVKRVNKKAQRAQPVESSPQIFRKQKSSNLIATGGIQKRNMKTEKKVQKTVHQKSKKEQKMQHAAQELLKTSSTTLKKISAGDLKKKSKKR